MELGKVLKSVKEAWSPAVRICQTAEPWCLVVVALIAVEYKRARTDILGPGVRAHKIIGGLRADICEERNDYFSRVVVNSIWSRLRRRRCLSCPESSVSTVKRSVSSTTA